MYVETSKNAATHAFSCMRAYLILGQHRKVDTGVELLKLKVGSRNSVVCCPVETRDSPLNLVHKICAWLLWGMKEIAYRITNSDKDTPLLPVHPSDAIPQIRLFFLKPLPTDRSNQILL